MKYKLGDKLSLKQSDMLIEVISIMPGAQMNHISTNGKNYYGVLMNGFNTLMSEEVLLELMEKINVVLETPQEIIIETAKEQPKLDEVKKPKKKVTRKPKE